MSFSTFTCTLKFETQSQLTQSPFTGTDCLFVIFSNKVNVFAFYFQGAKFYFGQYIVEPLLRVCCFE